MRKDSRYKIIISALSAVVIIESALLVYLVTAPLKKKVKAPLPKEGNIAIVLDDWGYNPNNLHLLEEIKYPLTVAVLPRLNYSALIARRAQEQGKEVILHLPMEPYEKFRMEHDTIMVSMDEAKIKDILDKDLANIASARGVNNHMGSKLTSDERALSIVFSELKKRGLYFLDSFVSPKSLGSSLASRIGLGFARRDIFLDNNSEPGYIKTQIEKLKTRSRQYGYAIGIGHDRKNTLQVLKEAMPEITKEGYKFVFVSELVK